MSDKALKGRGKEQPRLFVFSLGLLFRRRIRRILIAHGWTVSFGVPRKGVDLVGVWGRKKTARRGDWIAKKRNVDLITIEDGFLRSIKTGRQGEPGLSLVLDRQGIYFDTNAPNDLHDLMIASRKAPEEQLAEAARGIALLRQTGLSKYNATQSDVPDLPDEYVLIVDQTCGDGAITLGGATSDSFADMLAAARADHPNIAVVIKTHPETNAGKRAGHYSQSDLAEGDVLLDGPVSPWDLFETAKAIYCVTSQLGMEAIFAGKRPIVFGKPFYAGWGLTEDRHPDAQFKSLRTPEHLFWAAYLKYTLWYDPITDQPSTFEATARNLQAKKRHWDFARTPIAAAHMRLWKRGFMRRYFQSDSSVEFSNIDEAAASIASAGGGKVIVWANASNPKLQDAAEQRDVVVWKVEDGFLRSAGLGAQLVQPCSLALDDLGIYYDPSQPSRLEQLIQTSDTLSKHDLARAKAVRETYVSLNLSKYNLQNTVHDFSPKKGQKVTLVPGQVEDDASILTGASKVKTNKDLVWAARQKFPDDFIIYKPHPDVEAGLRTGIIARDELHGVVDAVADNADIADLIARADRVVTITSLTGFEALMRGKQVVCYGAPFYAGWGLTEDVGTAPERRTAKPSLDALVHATLIDYPMYWDPVTQDPCSVEAVLHRFAVGELGSGGGKGTKMLSKLQGVFASYAHLWR